MSESAFALFDDEHGGACLLEGFRGELPLSAADSLAAAFASIEAAAVEDWVVLLADYELGRACVEASPALAPDAVVLPQTLANGPSDAPSAFSSAPSPLRAYRFARCARLDAVALEAFFAEKLAHLPEESRVAGVAEIAPLLDQAAYARSVEHIRQAITAGDCYQVNFTFPLRLVPYGDPLALYVALRRRQPVRYGGFLSLPSLSVLSFSPELFFERRGERVTVRPMKGTAARGGRTDEDEAQRERLLASPKERAENIMIVDLMRNDLGRVARTGSVRVDALCTAERYPTVWQMVSTVSAEVPDASLGELFAALFPCGSITGAPKRRAMQIIDALESTPRGAYTGAFGWLSPGGDCRLNVAIRTFAIPHAVSGDAEAFAASASSTHSPPAGAHPAKEAATPVVHFGVGSGIVIDADPAREYAECLLKARFLTRHDPGFELIETMRLQRVGAPLPGVWPERDLACAESLAACGTAERYEVPLWPRHLQRIGASARALGFRFDAQAVEAELALLLHEPSLARAPVWRVRLLLTSDGSFSLSHSPLEEVASATPLLARIARETQPAGDYLVRHKTSVRARYERALAECGDGVVANATGAASAGDAAPDTVPPREPYFDAILLNERGEVSEGARSNVFVERGGLLLTPPLRCGLLPGVLREELLAQGRAVEAVLHCADLLGEAPVYLGNALRGLLRVRIADR
ncbi:aminodeoxychorismate synthase, component I [Rhodocyclus tenuis]|uniref:chorismate-binding protein n=1 Tax=Rhodocyclus gracilis TaxID=2929842 RepID=UPI00129892CA|nr:bifunctional anthranilate synthase component I family protein/class IV aminotransferase [Rhodocyclus gracilis]MRD73178.1 aminodeoxychorismate synthase, component I [Rhodocyclus gracilis]